MLATKWFLIVAVSLGIIFSAYGCATIASHNSGTDDGQKTAGFMELTGKVVRITPCRTLVEIDAPSTDEGGKPASMRFFCFDPEAREGAKGVEKGDTVKVQYVFSPETQRNHVKKITKE